MNALDKFKKVALKHLIMSDTSYLDVIFGTIIANKLDSKPVWLYLVGAPSSGKTEILQALTGDKIFQLDKLTNKALISGWEESGGQKKENSLLPFLDGKVMIIKDFTAMIHERRENLLDVVGQLRAAYDGYFCKVFATGQRKGFYSKFGIIAGVTNVIDKHRGLLAELGERFLTYRCPEVSEEESTQRCWKVSNGTSTTQQETELRKAASAVIDLPLHKVILSDSFRKKIIELAQYVAIARCEVSRDQFSKEPEIPMPEIATRLTRQLCDLAVGVAVVRGQRYVTKDIQRLIQKTALDSLTLKRLLLLKILYNVFPAGLSSKQIAIKMRYSEGIIRRWCEDLHILDLIIRETISNGKTPIGDKLIWKIRYKTILKRIWG